MTTRLYQWIDLDKQNLWDVSIGAYMVWSFIVCLINGSLSSLALAKLRLITNIHIFLFPCKFFSSLN